MKMPKFEYDTVRFLKILLFLFGGFIILTIISWFFPYSIQFVLYECVINQGTINWGFPTYFLSGGWICFPMLIISFYLIFSSKIGARLELSPKLSGGILLGTFGSIISLIVLAIILTISTIVMVPYFWMNVGTGYYLFMISVIGSISTILIMIFTLLFEKEKLNSLRDINTTE